MFYELEPWAIKNLFRKWL